MRPGLKNYYNIRLFTVNNEINKSLAPMNVKFSAYFFWIFSHFFPQGCLHLQKLLKPLRQSGPVFSLRTTSAAYKLIR